MSGTEQGTPGTPAKKSTPRKRSSATKKATTPRKTTANRSTPGPGDTPEKTEESAADVGPDAAAAVDPEADGTPSTTPVEATTNAPDTTATASPLVSEYVTDTRPSHVERIRAVLAGEVAIDSKSAVSNALGAAATPVRPPGDRVAFGLDANIILKLHTRSLEAEYLGSKHAGLLVMPAQAVQEFWNNKSSTENVAKSVRDAFKRLDGLIKDLEPGHQEFQGAFTTLLDEFENSASHMWAPDFRAKVESTFNALAARAHEPRFPKSALAHISHERQMTKTPPGFKDTGNGDLYVWAEFLLGLMHGREDGQDFDLAVLITEDKKADWGKNGEAHPVLVAEAAELLGVPFETWDLKELKEFATSAS
ncbi:PIN-like domain-containing protein [Nocardioides sp. C4-1]|uniref:PIN-like domain-containing protein n=1 Tax=Nocardioides sp. C4-1 TaxID=3151851 RepID=UPI0032671D2D